MSYVKRKGLIEMKDKILRAITKYLYPYLIEEIKADYSYNKLASALKKDKTLKNKLNKLTTVTLQRTIS